MTCVVQVCLILLKQHTSRLNIPRLFSFSAMRTCPTISV